MRFVSTRDHKYSVTLSEAISEGLAPNKGLFVPEEFPKFDISEFKNMDSLIDIAVHFLSPFFDGDELKDFLDKICRQTFDFPLPLERLNETTTVLELFHGNTGAFKDVGARFLANCFGFMKGNYTILVATSGDTGSAVASAFYQQPNVDVIVLYPKDKISEFQEQQLTFWNENIFATRVNADFDACQKLVKEAFSSPELQSQFQLTSANSINIGRLLPQCVYYVYSSLIYHRKNGKFANFIIPTGNMGNAVAAIWTKLMGFPIDRIHLSTNANTVIPEYLKTGEFNPRSSVKTLANAMDVGNPSNLERYIELIDRFQSDRFKVSATSILDEEINSTIKKVASKYNYTCCPHTATAFAVHEYQSEGENIIVSTAHPFKFEEIISDVLNTNIDIPANLTQYLTGTSHVKDINASLSELSELLANL